MTLGQARHRRKDAYSLDLRKKIVETKDRGMSTLEVARAFGVGLYSVKRYAKTLRKGVRCVRRGNPGRHPKAAECARRLCWRPTCGSAK